ncbi:hypothetical protein T484DRAFT_2652481 [Baffinella frigidus]|nr:hypothetical protein T484DRAFT_2652481 [Cryptophyta sp. CCMP2293]
MLPDNHHSSVKVHKQGAGESQMLDVSSEMGSRVATALSRALEDTGGPSSAMSNYARKRRISSISPTRPISLLDEGDVQVLSLDNPAPAPVVGMDGVAAKFVPAGARGRGAARLPPIKGVDALPVVGGEAGGARRPGERGRGGARRNQIAPSPREEEEEAAGTDGAAAKAAGVASGRGVPRKGGLGTAHKGPQGQGSDPSQHTKDPSPRAKAHLGADDAASSSVSGSSKGAGGNPDEHPERDENYKPPPPAPRVETPPPQPPGMPARVLSLHQERRMLRDRRTRLLGLQVTHMASTTRRVFFLSLVGPGPSSLWRRGTRPYDPLFFPRHFFFLCYLICFMATLLNLYLVMIFTDGFDLTVSFSWAAICFAAIAWEFLIAQVPPTTPGGSRETDVLSTSDLTALTNVFKGFPLKDVKSGCFEVSGVVALPLSMLARHVISSVLAYLIAQVPPAGLLCS